MTQFEIARLACRLIALYLFVQALVMIGNIVLVVFAVLAALFSGGRHWAEFTAYISPVWPATVLALVGLWVWKKSDWLADRMLTESSADGKGFLVTPLKNDPATQAEAPLLRAGAHETAPPTASDRPRLGAQDLMIVGLTVAGAFVLLQGAQLLTSLTYLIVRDFRAYGTAREIPLDRLLAAVLTCVIGFLLLFGSRAVAGLIRSVRGKYADYGAPDETTES